MLKVAADGSSGSLGGPPDMRMEPGASSALTQREVGRAFACDVLGAFIS